MKAQVIITFWKDGGGTKIADIIIIFVKRQNQIQIPMKKSVIISSKSLTHKGNLALFLSLNVYLMFNIFISR